MSKEVEEELKTVLCGLIALSDCDPFELFKKMIENLEARNIPLSDCYEEEAKVFNLSLQYGIDNLRQKLWQEKR